MTTDPSKPEHKRAAYPGKEEPGWARGLRDMYDSVVHEPLPDDFKDLLDKLDGDSA